MNETLTFVLDLIGTIVFAFSGAYVAIDHDLDWLGIVLMACTTACGGGMTRDIILNNIPNLFINPLDVSVAALIGILTMAIYKPLSKSSFKEHIMFTINTFDAMGLAIFAITGVNVAIANGYVDNAFLCVFLGCTTAVGGGLLRDVMVNRTPIILSKEIYATAALAGAITYYYIYLVIPNIAATLISIFVTFAIRMWAIKNNKNLPLVAKD